MNILIYFRLAKLFRLFGLSKNWIAVIHGFIGNNVIICAALDGSLHWTQDLFIIDPISNKPIKTLYVIDDETESPNLKKYPHKCPKCGFPAFIGYISIDCSNCKN